MKNKFRASFSVLNAWAKGDWERAVEMYFKLDDFTNQAMEEGKEWHKKWENEIENTSCLPEVFGGARLEKPKTELKLEFQLADWLELVGVVDCYDVEGDVYEFKTGHSSSQSYANSMQTRIYGLLLKLHKQKVRKAIIHRYNQHSKKADCSYLWLTSEQLKNALDWVHTFSSEMHNYLEENDLYKELGNKNKEKISK